MNDFSPQDSKVQGPKETFGKGKPLVGDFGVGSESGWAGSFSSEIHPLAPPPGRAPPSVTFNHTSRPCPSDSSSAPYGLTTSGPAPTRNPGAGLENQPGDAG